ncbi:hypothetical protein KS2013_1662 [Kangiella sediminilitoris]|uniref:Uncharacterized protein n=1 Tax=Kangiella sediminilitoris TaxID=1144748 RepID=A0A1B3BC35_9GAMM|nr:hypothetical protein KS2013_1662 [Kangiella sediminilitoris]
MSLTVLIIGCFLQLMFAGFQFMFVVSSASGATITHQIKGFKLALLNAFVFILPLSSLTVIILLIFFYSNNSSYLTNWWHAIPVILSFVYLAYVTVLTKGKPKDFTRT